MKKILQQKILKKSRLLIVLATFLLPVSGFCQAVVTDPALTDPDYDAHKLSQVKIGAAATGTPESASTTFNARAINTANSNTSGNFKYYNPNAVNTCYIPPNASYTPVRRSDDGSIGPIALGFNFNLYGTNYSQVWINTNGNLTFTGPNSGWTSVGFPNNVPMVAGFWADVDNRTAGEISFKQTASSLIVTWNAVPAYGSSSGEVNTFQIILTDGVDPLLGLGRNVALNHKDMQWAYGAATPGVVPVMVGVNKGNGTDYVLVGKFWGKDNFYDGPGGNPDGIYYLDGLCSYFNVSNAGNIAPSSTNLPSGNTVNLNVGQSVTIAPQFIGPEVNQTVSTSVNTNGLCGITTGLTNGNVSTANVTIVGSQCNVGTHTISLTATDNGIPARSLTETITINVIPVCNTVLSTQARNVSCAGGTNGSVDLGITGGTAPFTFNWSNGATTEDLSNVPAGAYSVTVTDVNNCTATTTVSVGTTPDVTNPTLTAPATVNAFTDNGSCVATNVSLGNPVASDNCMLARVINNAPASFPVGSTTITWTATDAAGNVATATQLVTITDNQAPAFAPVSNLPVNTDANVCGAQVNFTAPVATDNCSATTTQIAGLPSGSVFPVGTTTNTFEATDASNNKTSVSFEVIVKDKEVPAMRTKPITVTLVNGVATITEADIDNGSTDACGIAYLGLDITSFDCSNLGTNTVTLTAEDNNGNYNSETATVTVLGTMPSAAITVNPASGLYTGGNPNNIYLGYGAQSVGLTATGGTSYSWSPATGLSGSNTANPVFTATTPGKFTFTVTATNAYGCSAKEAVEINVIDAVCGNNRDKVLICHNGSELCVAFSAVPAHLNHAGDKLGGCKQNTTGMRIAQADRKPQLSASLVAYPNPFTAAANLEITLATAGAYKAELLDMKGRLVKVIANEDGKAGETYGYEINSGNLAGGMYLVRLITASEVKYLKLMLDK